LFDGCDTDPPCPPDEIPTEDEIPIEEEDPAPPATPGPPDESERRTVATTIYIYDPKQMSSSCYTRETRYHVVDKGLPEDALPDAPCSCCGGRRFIAKEDQLRHWRCIRCTPPCPNERVVVYDVPEEEEDDNDADDEQTDQ
jgi:hypothetical protein